MTKRKTELLETIETFINKVNENHSDDLNVKDIIDVLNKCTDYIKTSRDAAWLRPEDIRPENGTYYVRMKEPDYMDVRLARYIPIRDEWVIYPRMDIVKTADIYAYCEKDNVVFSEELVQHF